MCSISVMGTLWLLCEVKQSLVLGVSLLAAVLPFALTPSVTSECEMALKTREDRRL